MKAAQARLSLYLPKCHIVGNHMSHSIIIHFSYFFIEGHLVAISAKVERKPKKLSETFTISHVGTLRETGHATWQTCFLTDQI